MDGIEAKSPGDGCGRHHSYADGRGKRWLDRRNCPQLTAENRSEPCFFLGCCSLGVAGRPGCPAVPGPDFSFHPIADARQRHRAAQGALFAESSGELGYGILWGLWRDGLELTPASEPRPLATAPATSRFRVAVPS